MSTEPDEAVRRPPEALEATELPLPHDDRHLSAVFERSFQSTWLVAPDGTLLDANRAAVSLMAMPRADALGSRFWEAAFWGDSAQLRTDLRSAVAAVAAGAFVRFEAELPAVADGLTLDLSFTALPGPDGQTALVIVEGRDVGARARAERALRESEERFNRIVSIAADSIISMDEAYRITLFNNGAEQIFGYAASEVLGQPLDILLPAGIPRKHAQAVSQFASGDVSARRMGERREIFGCRKSGEVFRAEASISKVTVGGRMVFTAVLRDVSERWAREEERTHLLELTTRAREEAERDRARAAFLADLSDAVSASLDAEELARTAARLVVLRVASFCLVDVLTDSGALRRVEVLHADPGVRAATEFLRSVSFDHGRTSLTRRALDTGTPEIVMPVSDEWLVKVAHNEPHLEALRALNVTGLFVVPIKARGNTLGAIAFGQTGHQPFSDADCSLCIETTRRIALAMDNARLYHVAQDAARQRDVVLGVVSHDLRNPLSAIGMCVTGLEHSDPKDEQGRAELLGTIRESADWAQRLIADLLDVSSIEAGRLSFEPRPVDPTLIVARAAHLFEARAVATSTQLALEVPDDIPLAMGDDGRILQVISNLLSNALKFSPRGGTITIRVAAAEDAIRFAVQDDGPGIPDTDVPRLFDRFWHARRGGEGRGTGLGLAIAKGIVDAHGGRIWVDTAPGAGTTFHFTVPRVSGHQGDRPVKHRGAVGGVRLPADQTLHFVEYDRRPTL